MATAPKADASLLGDILGIFRGVKGDVETTIAAVAPQSQDEGATKAKTLEVMLAELAADKGTGQKKKKKKATRAPTPTGSTRGRSSRSSSRSSTRSSSDLEARIAAEVARIEARARGGSMGDEGVPELSARQAREERKSRKRNPGVWGGNKPKKGAVQTGEVYALMIAAANKARAAGFLKTGALLAGAARAMRRKRLDATWDKAADSMRKGGKHEKLGKRVATALLEGAETIGEVAINVGKTAQKPAVAAFEFIKEQNKQAGRRIDLLMVGLGLGLAVLAVNQLK